MGLSELQPRRPPRRPQSLDEEVVGVVVAVAGFPPLGSLEGDGVGVGVELDWHAGSRRLDKRPQSVVEVGVGVDE